MKTRTQPPYRRRHAGILSPTGLILLATTAATTATAAAAPPPPGEAIPEIGDADLGRLLTLIKPQRGESPWREIAWMTDVTAARRRAVAENKPLLFFTAADGSPLGRT